MRRIPALLILLVLALCSGCSVLKNAEEMRKATTPSPEYERPRILLGESAVRKEPVFADTWMGMVTDLQRGTFYKQNELELAVVGKNGARFLRKDRSVGKSVRFQGGRLFGIGGFDPVNLIYVEGDGIPAFLCRGKTANSAAILYNSDGTRRWEYEPFLGVHDAAAGDMDGDKRPEIVTSVTTGLDLLTAEGKKVWTREDGNVWHVEMADVNGDGKAEILHSNAGGELTIRDATGKVLFKKRPDIYLGQFAIANWDKGSQQVVAPADGLIYIFGFDAHRTARFDAPLMLDLSDIKGTSVHLQAGLDFFATLMNYGLWDRSALYIHKRSGELVYHEILGENCGAILAYPSGGAEHLLVGCQGRVFEYTFLEGQDRPAKGAAKRKGTH